MARLFLLFGLVLLVNFCQGFTFDLPPRVEDCYFEEILKGTDVGLVFQVTNGGSLDIDTTIIGPGDEVLYSATKESEGKYFFVTHVKGQYKVCFSNQMSTITTKTISFALQIGNQRSEEEIVQAILAGRSSENEDDDEIGPLVTPLQSSIMQLADGLHSIQGEEKYMRLRERVHRDTTESTNTRILVTTIIENGCLIAVSVLQVFFLKRFFEVKRAI